MLMRMTLALAATAIVSITAGSADADFLYISGFNSNAIYKVDATTGALVQTISSPNFLQSPSGLALSSDGSKLYASGTNSSNADVYVFDGGSGSLVGQFSSSLTGGRGLALSADGSTLYQSGVGSSTIEAYNTATGVGAVLASGLNRPQGLALSKDGNSLFVASSGGNSIREIAVHPGGVNRTLAAPAAFYSPSDVLLSPDGSTLYVSTFGDSAATNNQILRYDVATGSYLGNYTISGPTGDLYGLAITPDGSRLYVADNFNSLIYTVNTATGVSSSFATAAPINGPAFILYSPYSVPEPSSLALCGVGMAICLGGACRRRGV